MYSLPRRESHALIIVYKFVVNTIEAYLKIWFGKATVKKIAF